MNSLASSIPISLNDLDLLLFWRNFSKASRVSVYHSIVLGDLPSVRLKGCQNLPTKRENRSK